MSKLIYLKDSIDKVIAGIDIIGVPVELTLGPSGKTVIIHEEGQEPFITKDGVTVGESINNSDPAINAGIQLFKKVMSKMNTDNEDGTTTVTVLCRAFIKLFYELKKNNEHFDNAYFKKEFGLLIDKTIKKIQKNSIETTLEHIKMIASTSANNDEEIGNLFQTAYNRCGKEGHLNIVESTNGTSYVDIVDGYVVDLGYSDRKYANNPITNFFEAPECHVLILDGELTERKEISEIINYFFNHIKKQNVLIFAKDFSKAVTEIVDFNKNKNGFDICLIKNHLRNTEYKTLLSDIAEVTGATVFTEFDKFATLEGTGYNVVVKSGYTIFQYPESETLKDNLTNWVELLKMALKEEKSFAESEALKKRISRLTNGITTIYVGGDSDIEIKEKRDRVDDAFGACKAAFNSSIIIGGGQALYLIAREMLLDNQSRDKLSAIEKTFYQSILTPFFTILKNSEHTLEQTNKIYSQISWQNGYNAKTRRYENLLETGVVDPSKVTIGALKNAYSIASLILSTECLIVEEPHNTNRNEYIN